MKFSFFTFIFIFFSGFIFIQPIKAQQSKYTSYVNPLIGTARMGHVFPGATVPFGMVQLSLDTDTVQFIKDGKYNPDVYKYCAGYQYGDKTIVGFSHTHFSGTGHSDLGDFLIMPTVGNLQLNPGTANDPASGYRSRFDHANETAKPGYYSVLLDDYQIKAELTATERVGFHQYEFPKSDEAHIIFDLSHGIYNYEGKNIWTVVRVENDTLITGYRQTLGWARTRTVYFAMRISKPIKSYGAVKPGEPEKYNGFWRKFDQSKNFPDLAARQLKMYFNFETEDQEKIKIKFALSAVSTAGALLNLDTEIPHWNFEQTAKEADAKWEKELSKIEIEAATDTKINFYTAMYHAFIAPNVFTDVDGQYRGLDYNIHRADGFTNYTTFSLWDTYRTLHPLYNLIQPKRNGDMVQSMLAHYDQSVLNMLPIWSHYANENWCMSGYHSVSVIADAIIKGTAQVDARKALAACVQTARTRQYEGIGEYIDMGYVPSGRSGTSVSNTLEYAYDDWAIARLAMHVGDTAVYEEFLQRSKNYRNVFDTDGFVKSKNKQGKFTKNFDALDTHGQGLIEGNSWNYSFFVPHDPMDLIRLMGGKKKFVEKLDRLFTMHLPDKFFEKTEDITRDGIIGTYVHGNEPAHHVAYLYNFAGRPDKTQALIRKILNHQYKPTPDGLGGNDDCGQMSAWFIFSALGFYPVAPASPAYQLGSPIIDQALIHLENGKTIQIKVKNQSEKNSRVQNWFWNGKKIKGTDILYSNLMQGGVLEFEMK